MALADVFEKVAGPDAPVEFRALRGLFMSQRVLLSGYTSLCNPGDSARVTSEVSARRQAGSSG